MLKLANISVAYKDKKVLDNFSLTADAGEIIGVVAPNGTGKTTLFNVMANFIKPNTGNVTFNEKYTYQSEKEELFIHKNLTTFPEQSDLFEELTGVDHLNLYGDMWKGTRRHIPGIIEQLKMGNYVKRKVRTYSLGMRQRLCFAMMIAADTPIMLMDEVMNGLDVANVALISERLIELKKEQKLIFVASHLLGNLDLYADRVLYLKDGKIIHQQQLNRKNDVYLKLSLDPSQYQKLKTDYKLPAEHLYIANQLFCLPLEEMELSEQTKWIECLLDFEGPELAIGPLGTVDYYKKYYPDTK
ncbi:ATP-binding cassette domain-containing protein [Sporosarcina sp. NPDC096371]|uniref:ATP-binding cassette domain-containing protein n=1 Tax=Sporosarcina sp. NPDC096371 TaxID=3364530 RepID=UPI00380D9E58